MKVFEAPPTFDREAVIDLMRLADDSEKQVREYLHQGRLFVLQEKGAAAPVGQLLVVQAPNSRPEIKSLSISANRQGKGLGRLLVGEVLSTLKREGIQQVTVATSTADIGNIAFYQKAGFRCLKIERNAFTSDNGYADGLRSNGILVRDKIWFDLEL
jgi:ribosomal protein S18 acetylase RimI-like enzyme